MSPDNGVCMIHDVTVYMGLEMVVYVQYMTPWCVCVSTGSCVYVIHDALVCVCVYRRLCLCDS